MKWIWVISLLGPLAIVAITMGSLLLRKALLCKERLVEEFALALAWVFIVGSLVWFGAFLRGSSLLGFRSPWTWLAATHFAFAGYGAITITALTCRCLSRESAKKVLRVILITHPIAYLITAAGISGLPYANELGATCYEMIFLTQLIAFTTGKPNRIERGPRLILSFALTVPVLTMTLAIAWAWGNPYFDLSRMIKYHGLVNAVGHVGLGFVAFVWSHPKTHAES
jgi:hypothetical protein